MRGDPGASAAAGARPPDAAGAAGAGAPAPAASPRGIGKNVARVGVRDTKSRWGSCSSQGTLSFSWRLVFAPEAVIDYVVAHEVAHLVEMNHGPRFWRLVATPGARCARAARLAQAAPQPAVVLRLSARSPAAGRMIQTSSNRLGTQASVLSTKNGTQPSRSAR